MKKVELLNLKGEKVKDINLNEEIFGITPNKNVLTDAIILSMASLRQTIRRRFRIFFNILKVTIRIIPISYIETVRTRPTIF